MSIIYFTLNENLIYVNAPFNKITNNYKSKYLFITKTVIFCEK